MLNIELLVMACIGVVSYLVVLIARETKDAGLAAPARNILFSGLVGVFFAIIGIKIIGWMMIGLSGLLMIESRHRMKRMGIGPFA